MSAWQPEAHWLQVIGYWQTLIASILAVLAGVGAIWATISSANREVRAVQDQIANAERLEKRRIAREGFVTLALLDAALDGAMEDYQSAVFRALNSPHDGKGYDRNAAGVRTSFHMLGFSEARSRLVSHGGLLTHSFLGLQRSIENFGSKLIDEQTAGLPVKLGYLPDLHGELARIGLGIEAIRAAISSDFEQCNKILDETQNSLFKSKDKNSNK